MRILPKSSLKIVHYLIIYVISLLLMVATSVFLNSIAHNMETGVLRATVIANLGILISLGLFFIIRHSQKTLTLKPMYIGTLSSLIWGLSIGLMISFASGLGFGISQGYPISLANLSSNLHINILANIFPALCEEIVFRGGIVHTTSLLLGKIAGLFSGSVPFGILHLLGPLFGQSVTISQIAGISLAGFMLSPHIRS